MLVNLCQYVDLSHRKDTDLNTNDVNNAKIEEEVERFDSHIQKEVQVHLGNNLVIRTNQRECLVHLELEVVVV